MGLLVSGILMVLNILNVALHTIGTCALITLYKSSEEKPQRMFLINHSVCECVLHVLEIFKEIPKLLSLPKHHLVNTVGHCIEIIVFVGFCFLYYLSMVYLTLDRLAKILLHQRYNQHWDERKTKRLLMVTWFIGLLVCMVSSVTSLFVEFNWEVTFHRYVFPIADGVFILIALITFTFIVRRYHREKKDFLMRKFRETNNVSLIITVNEIERRGSTYRGVRSTFFVPILLISVFLVLMVIPDLTYFFVTSSNGTSSRFLQISLWVLNAVASQVDACVYLFFLPDVRKLVSTKLLTLKCPSLCACVFSYNSHPVELSASSQESGIDLANTESECEEVRTSCFFMKPLKCLKDCYGAACIRFSSRTGAVSTSNISHNQEDPVLGGESDDDCYPFVSTV